MDTTTVENPLTEMFLHNLWADQQLLRACQALSEEQLEADCDGTFGSIYKTLLHIVRAASGYVRTLGGDGSRWEGRLDPGVSIAAMREYAAEIDETLAEMAGQMGQNDTFPSHYEGRLFQLPGPRCLVQVINHATEHRAQVATILTQLGIEPPDLSGWAYMDAMGLAPEPA